MKILKSLFALAFFALLSSLHVAAQNVPLAISYQAVLTDDAGGPLSPGAPTNFNLIFRIFDNVEGGELLWAETQGVSVFEGSFSTLLGTGDTVGIGADEEPRPTLDTVFDGKDRYLEITIEDGSLKTFTPRQRMVATPFAFRASIAEEALKVVDGGIQTIQLLDRVVTAPKLGAASVTAEKIASNAVGNVQIASNAVGSDEIADEAVNIDKLAIAVQNLLMPAGSVVAWAGLTTSIPNGWFLCDGQALSKTVYSELYAAVGDIYGQDGANFNVPDYRGYFLRADALDTGRDPDRNARGKNAIGGFEGSSQGDQLRSHRHTWSHRETTQGTGDAANQWDTGGGTNQGTRTYNTSITGGNETRPDNKYVHYIIKAH